MMKKKRLLFEIVDYLAAKSLGSYLLLSDSFYITRCIGLLYQQEPLLADLRFTIKQANEEEFNRNSIVTFNTSQWCL